VLRLVRPCDYWVRGGGGGGGGGGGRHSPSHLDDATAEIFRGPQELISHSFLHHLQMAQDVFGGSVGVGFRCQLTCQMGEMRE